MDAITKLENIHSIRVTDPKSKKDVTCTLKCLKALKITSTIFYGNPFKGQ